jgi:hypothetical protein
LSKHALHGGVVEAELRGDGANRLLFAVVEAHISASVWSVIVTTPGITP